MAMAVSSQQSRDAALLRATTELFVLDKAHDQAEIRRFEELTAHFLTKVTPADRAFVAERLARHPDAPGAILRMLGKDLVEIASPVLRHAELSSFDLLAILAATGPAHFRMIAARDDLAPDIVQALRLTGDAETIALLPEAAEDAPLAYEIPPPPVAPEPLPAVAAVAPAPEEPAVPAVSKPEVAPVEPANQIAPEKSPLSALAAARVLTASLSAELTAIATETPVPEGLSRRTFESLARAQKQPAAQPEKAKKPTPAAAPVAAAKAPEPTAPAPTATTEAAEPVAPAPVAAPHATDAFLGLDRAGRLARLASISGAPIQPSRLTPMEIDHAFRAAMSRARLSLLARQRQRDALIRTLAEGLRLDVDRVTALLDDPSGEALVVLLRAIGLTDAEAQQVLLLANPVISSAVETFFRLTGLLGGLEKPVADRLVAEWRNDGTAASPSHQPHFADAPRKETRQPATGHAADHAKPDQAKPVLTGTMG
ncbi:hypothetical protein K32_14000 [Kaistia sp. 32K]|uniref:hypothetical protein n=1 Tax=Kaistia sp. 32K TaxID=2795690 RepID=UPI0019161137|nr:hypothetical protein [Kaistia sp. 32K]BCP52783.1 hypothetical protein K32_14000 [Kaistia sp. 32K]